MSQVMTQVTQPMVSFAAVTPNPCFAVCFRYSVQTTQDNSQRVDKNGAGDVASPVPSLALTESDYGETEVISPRSSLQR